MTDDPGAATRYASPMEWVEARRAIVRKDLDNLMLLTGPERMGKSRLALQILSALDPRFDVSRVCMTIQEFLGTARSLPPGSAILLDEAPVSGRMAMHRQNLAMIDFLRECGGLNLHIGVCYPRIETLDPAIRDLRVAYNLHVPGGPEMGLPADARPGMWLLFERRERPWINGEGDRNLNVAWVERGSWPFEQAPRRYQACGRCGRGPRDGDVCVACGGKRWHVRGWPLLDAYLEKKSAHMRRASGVGAAPQIIGEAERAAAVEILAGLRRLRANRQN